MRRSLVIAAVLLALAFVLVGGPLDVAVAVDWPVHG